MCCSDAAQPAIYSCLTFVRTGHPDQSVCEQNVPKVKFYPSTLNFFKIVHTIFRVIIFQDFAAPSLQNDAFDLQTSLSGQPVLTNGKCPRSLRLVLLMINSTSLSDLG